MLHLGCAAAWAGVARAMSSSDVVRKGPPDAVSVSLSSERPSPMHWKIALCSESTGRIEILALAAASMRMLPAHTILSLLARAR